MSRSISDLTSDMQPLAVTTISEMRKDTKLTLLGVEDVYISETKRNLAVQMAYYSRSRMAVEDVKKMYAAAGLYQLSDQEAKTANTWTLQSKHIEGKAIDIVPVKNGKLWWTAPDEVWERMGIIGEANGLKWGGRWKNKDCPHFEI